MIVNDFLEQLKIATKVVESSNQCLDIVLPIMDFVLDQFEKAREKYTDHDILGPMFQSSWQKMTKYYKLTDDSPVYVCALLNP